MSHTTVFYKAKPKAHTYMYSLRSSSFIKSQHSTSQETLLWSWNLRSKAYLVTLAKIQDTQRHEVATIKSLELYSILWSDWPTSKQKVLCQGHCFAAQVRRHYFSEEEKRQYICSRATLHATWLIPLSATTATEYDKKAEAMQISELLKINNVLDKTINIF